MKENLNKEYLKPILFIITFSLVLYYILKNFALVLSLLGKFISILSPFIIGFCIAFIINMALRPIEGLWDRLFETKKGRRPICLILSLLFVLGIILAIFLVILPKFKDTLTLFIEALPYNLAKTEKWFQSFSKNFDWTSLSEMGLTTEEIVQTAKNYISRYGQNFIGKTFDVTTSVISAVTNVIVGIVLSIYMLSQKESLISQIKKVLFALFPADKVQNAIDLTRFVNKTFTSFVSGQLTESVIIGILCFIGMIILRIPYAPVISVLVGFTALIPIFGSFIGTAIGAFLILLAEPIKALWFVIFIIVLQQLEGNLIYPKVVGKSVGLPGILVLSAVTLGGNLFGLLGMLICVPVSSVLYTLFKTYISKKQNVYDERL